MAARKAAARKTAARKTAAKGRQTRSQFRANCPEIRKRGLIQRLQQILRPRGPPRSWFRANGALDHFDVAIAPFHKSLIEVDQALRNLGYCGVFSVYLDQNLLHL